MQGIAQDEVVLAIAAGLTYLAYWQRADKPAKYNPDQKCEGDARNARAAGTAVRRYNMRCAASVASCCKDAMEANQDIPADKWKVTFQTVGKNLVGVCKAPGGIMEAASIRGDCCWVDPIANPKQPYRIAESYPWKPRQFGGNGTCDDGPFPFSGPGA